ncbi:DUF6155 family protein [Saprospiraceae bacterium]|nr:DUF6155 family protein [Saprospiraceae bacterium]
MRKSSFVKHISQLEEEDLRSELLMLFSKVKAVSEFYKMELGSEADRKRLYDKAKKDIASKFATKSYRRPRRPRIQKTYKILSDVKSKTVFDYEMIDVYLFTSETAVEFVWEYEFASTPVFNMISKTFDSALSIIKLCNMEDEYEKRCEKLVNKIKFDRDLKAEMAEIYNKVYQK